MSSPEDLEYSEFISRIQGQPKRTYSKNENVWIPDSSVKTCSACGTEFTFWIRRHHCKFCKKIFCYRECSKFMVIYDTITSSIGGKTIERKTSWFASSRVFISGKKTCTKLEPEPVRVCDDCYQYLTELKDCELHINIIKYCDKQTICNLAKVSKSWAKSCLQYLKLFREIQTYTIDYEFSDLQKQILKTFSPYLSGHSHWLLKYVSAISIVEHQNLTSFTNLTKSYSVPEVSSILLEKQRCKTCQELKCYQICNESIQAYEWVQILETDFIISVLSSGHDLQKDILKSFYLLPPSEFIVFLPLLVSTLKNYKSDSPMLNLLIQKSCESTMLRVNIYWTFIMFKTYNTEYVKYYNQYMLTLHYMLGKENIMSDLITGRQIVKFLTTIDENYKYSSSKTLLSTFNVKNIDYENVLEVFKQKCIKYYPYQEILKPQIDILYPLNTEFKILGIDATNITPKVSSTNPTCIPLICSNTNTIVTKEILRKPECLVQDLCCINIIQYMSQILIRDLGCDFGIKTYRVLPVNRNIGIIECVPNAETLYTIMRVKKLSLLNYIMEQNPKLESSEIRSRIVRSCASYCVITYLLGIGDRHLDNIMVTSDGYLFHIDYGFILGNDPRPAVPAIRITSDIVDALGGVESSSYSIFKTLCAKVYLCLRKYTSLFMIMLNLICEDGLTGRYSKDKIKKEILSRFLPSETDENAEAQLQIKIESSYNSYTSSLMIDMIHTVVKEARSYSGSGSKS